MPRCKFLFLKTISYELRAIGCQRQFCHCAEQLHPIRRRTVSGELAIQRIHIDSNPFRIPPG